jgi:GT2 family glycosyltransferase
MKVVKQYPAQVYGLLNNDLICHPDMLATVLAQFRDPDVGIVAPGSSDEGTGVLYVPHPGPWGNVEAAHIDNHALFIHSQVFEDIGMDECEDFTERKCWYWNRWLCYLARKAGYKVIAARDAYVDHLGGGYNAEADAAGLAWITARLGSEVEAAL